MKTLINLDGNEVLTEVSVYTELYSAQITFYFEDKRAILSINLSYDDIFTAEDLCAVLESKILTSELCFL